MRPVLLLLAYVSACCAGRLTVNNTQLWRDGAPFITRGVAYSPTPIGDRPEDTILDYFGPAHNSTWQRDLQLLTAMGANAIRIYAFDESIDHEAFFDACMERGLTIMGGMEILTTSLQAPLSTPLGLQMAELQLFTQLNALFPSGLAHEAVGIWAVGNEVNADWKEFLCDEDSSHAPCQFGANATALFLALDRLCETVKSFGLLCTSPLAEVPQPDGSGAAISTWVDTLDAQLVNFDIWTANVYRGSSFGDLSTAVATSTHSGRPFLVTEYGVDAWDSCACYINITMGVNEAAQAEWVIGLATVRARSVVGERRVGSHWVLCVDVLRTLRCAFVCCG